MEDNNQPNVPPNMPPYEVQELDEGLTEFLNFMRRETMFTNRINTQIVNRPSYQLRSVSALSAGIPSNHLYFHSDPPDYTLPYRTATNMVLANSLHDYGGVKNVISEKGKQELKRELYKKDEHINNICPITQEEFSDGDTVIVLPCNHCFYPAGINRWLENNKAECPVCRHKLSSKEVFNTEDTEDSDDEVPTLTDNSTGEHMDIDEDDEDVDDDEDEGNIASLPNPPNLNIVGNNIHTHAINPLLRQMIENMVQRRIHNYRVHTLDASSNNITPDTEDVDTEDVNTEDVNDENESADMVDEDSVDLQLALYASMIDTNDPEDVD